MSAPHLTRIDNIVPRRDSSGHIVDAHDGGIERFGERYFLYGTAYGASDGFTQANIYVCYSSADLNDWTFHGPILPERPPGVYYRPRVKYCAASGLYVLWYNWYPVLWEGQYGVAVSKQPQGPFRIVHAYVPVSRPRPGDHGLFDDDDGIAYLIYTAIGEGHAMVVERLTPDYLSSTGASSGPLAAGVEAGTLFKRQGRYYALFDSCCCFCPQGSGAQVYTASAPLGPYRYAGNINRRPEGGVIVAAQQTQVATIATSNGAAYLWLGDRWGSAPDGVKGHDFQFWSPPLRFSDDGLIDPLSWSDSWAIELAQATGH